MEKLVLQDVVKVFKKNVGVLGINLEVREGEFFVILGPSGCGKTTSLRMIAGLETVDSGHIFLDEREITNFPPKLRNISMVFQNYALYPFMTVRENIIFPLKILKMPKSEMEEKTEQIAKTMGLSDLLDRRPGEISGGQKQRVALARALVREPSLFLMDEPLSNLDAKLRGHMRVELKRLQKEFNTTTVYVTHDQIEATTLADRACLMNNGRIVQMGNPNDLYDLPVDTFTATFLGDPAMNILPGELYVEKGNTYLKIEDYTIKMNDIKTEMEHPRDVKVGIRPEEVQLGDDGIPVELNLVQNLGKSIYEYFKTKNGETIIRQDVVNSRHVLGDRSMVSVDEKSLYLFETNTGGLIYRYGKKKYQEEYLQNAIN
ncbi:MAG: ABC transporter ATP-binding protein [Candidatus Thermoplasmatota archaeon]|nr:ABC transporter ATP-binding protein [Candidatus Thermoplasmatota archaeon]MCL5889053.1 ABC transporter ATP-binding protein [Candidatus Thermoplasmatota archaeon]